MIDTLALATEALNAEGINAYFDATPEQLAAFLDANPDLWNVSDTWNVPDTNAFHAALAKHLNVYERVTRALANIDSAKNPETFGEQMLDALYDAGFSPDDEPELIYDNMEDGYTGTITVDTGWPVDDRWIECTFRYLHNESVYVGTWEWSA